MSINIDILNNTPRNFIEVDILLIERANSKELKGENILFLNQRKNETVKLQKYYSDRNNKAIDLFEHIVAEYSLKREERYISVYRNESTFSSRNCRLLSLLKLKYKAKLIYYTLSNYYSKYPPQIVGLKFQDIKYMTTFILKYGHIIQ